MSDALERGMAGSALAAQRWTYMQKATVRQAVRLLAERRATFTTDDVWAFLGPSFPLSKGVGAVMMAAKRHGWITQDGQEIAARGGEHDHAQRLTRWKSLICTTPELGL